MLLLEKIWRDIGTSKIFEFQFSKSLFWFIEGGQENIFIGPKDLENWNSNILEGPMS